MRTKIIATTILSSILVASIASAETRVSGFAQPAAGSGDLLPEQNAQGGHGEPVGSLIDSQGNGLSDGLESHLAGLRGDEPVDVLVQTSGPGLASVLQNAVGPFTVTHVYGLVDGFAATVNAGQARALAAQADVIRVELDAEATAFLDAGLPDFGIADLADHSDPAINALNGAGVTVCVIDTGIQGDHEQFNDGTTSTIVDFIDLTPGWSDSDFTTGVNPFGPIYDDNFTGHGTHVAGIVAGDGLVGDGPGADPVFAPRAKGGAPGVSLRIAKALDYAGSGQDSDVVAAVEWCVGTTPEDGPDSDIINLSLGIPGLTDCTDMLCAQVDAAVDAGVVVVAAGGNSGDVPGNMGSPAVSAKAITVGAVADFTANPNDPWHSSGIYSAIFSSQGPGVGGIVKPDIMAPGTTVLSARNVIYLEPTFGLVIDNECGEGCYAILDGTSQAAPYVTAVAALMLQSNPSLTPTEVKQILIDTAVDRLESGPDNITGHGVVDAAAAVTEAARRLDGGIAAMSNDFPVHTTGTAKVRKNGSVDIEIVVEDPTIPLAITVAIAGQVECKLQDIFGNCFVLEWTPDIDAYLFDANGNEVFYSGCPAAGDEPLCNPFTAVAFGQLETLYLPQPNAGPYRLQLFAVQDSVNLGQGGNVTYDISNGRLAGGGKKGGGGGGGGDGGDGGGKPCNPNKPSCT